MAMQYWINSKGQRVLMSNHIARQHGYTLHEDQSPPQMTVEEKARLNREHEERLIRRGF